MPAPVKCAARFTLAVAGKPQMRVPAAIRPAKPAHLAGIAALLVATFAPELEGVERASRLAEDATGLRHRLADNLLLVATPNDSEDVVGCVEVYTPAYLSRVAPAVLLRVTQEMRKWSR